MPQPATTASQEGLEGGAHQAVEILFPDYPSGQACVSRATDGRIT
jgi:hypothetical protein